MSVSLKHPGMGVTRDLANEVTQNRDSGREGGDWRLQSPGLDD